jgi:predicted HTH domain antitoxin
MAKKSQSEFMRLLSENGIPAIDFPADDLAAEAGIA